jgi:hypothetical protein
VRAVPKSDRGVAVQGVAALRIDVPTLDRETQA